MYICICNAYTVSDINDIIKQNNITNIIELQKIIQIADKCFQCKEDIVRSINNVN